MQFEANTITINDVETRYYEAGEPHRRTLFLLHGSFGDARLHWEGLVPHLHHFHIIAPDLPGYGGSAPLKTMNLDSLVTWAHDLLHALGLADVVVIGNAFGGLIARLLTARYEGDASALVLVNGGVIPDLSGVARFTARLPVIGPAVFKALARNMTSRDQLKLGIGDESLLTADFIERIRHEQLGLARLMRAMTVSPRPSPTVPRVPTLLLWGEDDAITPRVVGEHIAKNIPDSRLGLVADVRNMPHLEAPDIFVWQLENFLKEIDGPQI